MGYISSVTSNSSSGNKIEAISSNKSTESMIIDFHKNKNNDNRNGNSNGNGNTIEIEEMDFEEADGFSYGKDEEFIPVSQIEIDNNIDEIESTITELTQSNEKLSSEIKQLEDIYNGFTDYYVGLDYGLFLDDGKILTPEEYKQYLMRNDTSFLNLDGSLNEEKLNIAVAEYTEKYNNALSDYTNGRYSDINVLLNDINEKNNQIVANNEDIRLLEKEKVVTQFDSVCLGDAFESNYGKSSYLSKFPEEKQEEFVLFVTSLIGIPTIEDVQQIYSYDTGQDLSAFDLLECLAFEKYGIDYEKLRTMSAEEASAFINQLNADGYFWAVDAYNIYKYMNDKEIAIYKSLCDTEGIQKAGEYFHSIEEKINAIIGMEEAIGFFDDILEGSGYKLEDVQIVVSEDGTFQIFTKNENGEFEENLELKESFENVFRSFGEGLSDGLIGFFEGVGNAISASDNRSASDYKKLYIAYFLSKSVVLKGSYDVGTGIGNLIPSMLLSAITGYLGVPAAFQDNVGYILLGLSAYGNKKHDYLVEGLDGIKVEVGAVLNGVLEFLTGKLFGRIPWLNKEANLSLSEFIKEGTNIFGSVQWGKLFGAVLNNMAHEGVEEFIQTYFEAGFDCFVKGETYNIEETTKEALYSFLMGALTSGVLSGSNVSIDFVFNGVTYSMNQQQIEEFLEQVNGEDIDNSLRLYSIRFKSHDNVDNSINVNNSENEVSTIEEVNIDNIDNNDSIDLNNMLENVNSNNMILIADIFDEIVNNPEIDVTPFLDYVLDNNIANDLLYYIFGDENQLKYIRMFLDNGYDMSMVLSKIDSSNLEHIIDHVIHESDDVIAEINSWNSSVDNFFYVVVSQMILNGGYYNNVINLENFDILSFLDSIDPSSIDFLNHASLVSFIKAYLSSGVEIDYSNFAPLNAKEMAYVLAFLKPSYDDIVNIVNNVFQENDNESAMEILSVIDFNTKIRLKEEFDIDLMLDYENEIIDKVKNELPILMFDFFQNIISKEQIDAALEKLHLINMMVFEMTTNASGYNDINGSFVGSYDGNLIDVLSTIIHETIHELSNNGNVSGFTNSVDWQMLGLTECCTEYFTELLYGYEKVNSLYYPGVVLIKKLVDNEIFTLDDLMRAYFNNDSKYIISTLGYYSIDTDQFIDLFDQAINEIDQNNALEELDRIVNDIILEKNMNGGNK